MDSSNDRDIETLLRGVKSGFFSSDLIRDAYNIDDTDTELLLELYFSQDLGERASLSYFFDRQFYAETAGPPLPDRIDPLLHFLDRGLKEARSPHPFIDLQYMASCGILPPGQPIDDLVTCLATGSNAPTPYLDTEYYAYYFCPQGANPVHHFLTKSGSVDVTPNEYIDPAWYGSRYGDASAFDSGLSAHFVCFGDGAGRRPSLSFDPEWYRNYYDDLRGLSIPPLLHFLRHGIAEGRLPHPKPGSRSNYKSKVRHESYDYVPSVPSLQEGRPVYEKLKQGFRDSQRSRWERFLERPCVPVDPGGDESQASTLKFPSPVGAEVTILIPCYNEFEYTLECLLSISLDNARCRYKIVIADDCSTDKRTELFGRIPNLTYLRAEKNKGFLKNCNDAFRAVDTEYVLLLNNDAQVEIGAIDALHDAIKKDTHIGAVGPKILYPTGRLQEAGCRVNVDGSTEMIGLFDDPRAACYNFQREVDYCSGAALMVRRAACGSQLFDERYVPAYCEDVDLCLSIRDQGYSIHYIPTAVVYHHLSISQSKKSEKARRQLAYTNQQKLTQKWAEQLSELNKVRLIAFYLPQFHPIAQNDTNWGAGFTEWHNVTKARPCFEGHVQPRLPTDLGFYDLRLTDVMAQQQRLAARYGLEGFCVYYYNFNGERVLDTPLRRLLASPAHDFRFCICWANENWTTHWDGGERNVIFAQEYNEDLYASVADDALMYANDPRYITIDGRPLILVYRPLLLGDPNRFARLVRKRFRKELSREVYLAYVESMEAVNGKVQPAELGFDASVEFPPQGVGVRSSAERVPLKPGWNGTRYDFGPTISEHVAAGGYVPYKRFPGVFCGWDNTSRQPLAGDVFENASPEAFQAYVEAKIEQAKDLQFGEERIVFINAWNEWAEGAHLEPDNMYGHRWLEALRNASQCSS